MFKIIQKGSLERFFNEIKMAERLRRSADAIEQRALKGIKETSQAKHFYYNGKEYQIKERFNKNEGIIKSYITGLDKPKNKSPKGIAA